MEKRAALPTAQGKYFHLNFVIVARTVVVHAFKLLPPAVRSFLFASIRPVLRLRCLHSFDMW